jgi:hypothetical protein
MEKVDIVIVGAEGEFRIERYFHKMYDGWSRTLNHSVIYRRG